jgi:hypothetical protein
MERAPECLTRCQYALDVGMWPEHQCAGECQYPGRREKRERTVNKRPVETESVMDDEALAKFLGIHGDPRWQKAIATLPAEKRRAYERMHQVTVELDLWQAGLGPKPSGVMVD